MALTGEVEAEKMLWIIVVLLALMWFTPYTLAGLLPVLFAVVVVLYLAKLFAENRPV